MVCSASKRNVVSRTRPNHTADSRESARLLLALAVVSTTIVIEGSIWADKKNAWSARQSSTACKENKHIVPWQQHPQTHIGDSKQAGRTKLEKKTRDSGIDSIKSLQQDTGR